MARRFELLEYRLAGYCSVHRLDYFASKEFRQWPIIFLFWRGVCWIAVHPIAYVNGVCLLFVKVARMIETMPPVRYEVAYSFGNISVVLLISFFLSFSGKEFLVFAQDEYLRFRYTYFA